jgi:hypothetical protein
VVFVFPEDRRRKCGIRIRRAADFEGLAPPNEGSEKWFFEMADASAVESAGKMDSRSRRNSKG